MGMICNVLNTKVMVSKLTNTLPLCLNLVDLLLARAILTFPTSATEEKEFLIETSCFDALLSIII